MQIQAGAAAANSLGTGEPVATAPLALAAPDVTVGGFELRDEPAAGSFEEIVEAESVSDEEVAAIDRLKADAKNFALDPDRYVAGIKAGIAASPKDVPYIDRLVAASELVRAGTMAPVGFMPYGRVQWAQP